MEQYHCAPTTVAVWIRHAEGISLARWAGMDEWVDEHDPERVVCLDSEVLGWAFQDDAPAISELIYARDEDAAAYA